MKHFSTSYKFANLFLACFQNMTLGGILFGWASISGTVLISSKDQGGAALDPAYIHMIFTVASFFNFLGPLILGLVLDYYGPRLCSLVSIAFVATGCILFSFCDVDTFPYFIPAMCLIAFGGPGAQSAIIHLSNLFPTWKATATAILTGSFQLSFIVFLVFDQLWLFQKYSYRSLFLGYCSVCLVNAVISLIIWPDKPYSYDEVAEAEEIPDTEENLMLVGHIRLPSVFIHHSDFKTAEQNKKKIKVSGSQRSIDSSLKLVPEANLKDATLLEQLMSSQFIMLTFFFVVNSFWVNFYIGTFDTQMRDGSSLTDEEAHNFARIFTLIITFGVIAIPVVGTLMDNVGFPITSFVLIIMGFLWSVLLLVDTNYTLFWSFFFYSAFRTFFFTFVFAYLADTLGFKYFGVLAGIMFVLGGVLSVLQYPLAEYASSVCTFDSFTNSTTCTPSYWYQVNFYMAITILSTLVFSYQDWNRREKAAAVKRVGSRSNNLSSSEMTSLLGQSRPEKRSDEKYGTSK